VWSEASAPSVWVRFEALDKQNLVCFFVNSTALCLYKIIHTGLLISKIIEAEMVGMTNLESFPGSIGIVEVARNEILVKVKTAEVSHSQRCVGHRTADGTPDVDDLNAMMRIPKANAKLCNSPANGHEEEDSLAPRRQDDDECERGQQPATDPHGLTGRHHARLVNLCQRARVARLPSAP
jgi:hypothetical protein